MSLKIRESGIELLRLIGMFIICFSHCRRVFCLDEFSGSLLYLPNCISWGNIGNLIFIVISNYFLSTSKVCKKEKIINMIVDQLVISLIVMFITIVIMKKPMSKITILKQILIVFYGGNWFITWWLIYYLIHPFLNIIIDSIDKQTYTKVVVILTLFYGILIVIPQNAIPKENIIDFIVLHFIIGYIRKYYDAEASKVLGNYKFLICAVVIFLVSIFAFMMFSYFSKYDLWKAGTKRTYLLMVMVVLSLFYIFKKMKFANVFINEMASLVMLVYIIHENYYFKEYGEKLLGNNLITVGYFERHLYLIIFTIVYYIISFVLAFLYSKIKSNIMKRIKI